MSLKSDGSIIPNRIQAAVKTFPIIVFDVHDRSLVTDTSMILVPPMHASSSSDAGIPRRLDVFTDTRVS